MSYSTDRAFGEQYIPEVCRIVGPFLLQPSPFHIDTKKAADLIVLRAESVEIGVRIRRPGYNRYRDFTIRSERDNGAETEWSKVMRGFMRWMFYGWASEIGNCQLARWLLIDMNEFRYAITTRGIAAAMNAGAIIKRSNGDGTHFYACDPTKFWPRMIIAQLDDHIEAA